MRDLLDPSEELQNRAISTIRPLIPADAEDRVARTVRQFNAIIREHIRTETGLRLSDEAAKSGVGVHVVDGFPAGVAGIIDKHRDILLWRLITLQPKLGGVIEGLAALLETWDGFERWQHLPPVARGSRPALESSLEVARLLQHLATAKEVLEEIRVIREDILGAYHYPTGRPPRIEIYWMAQALFAAAFGVRIEDLTVVTLSHELAHAYTHLGRDIDGTAWDRVAFATSDADVKEGLAQHYTAIVTSRLITRAPNAHSTYQTLLKHQSGPYLAHGTWFEEGAPRRGEVVRFAMLQARTRGTVKDADWRSLITKTRNDLKKQQRTG
jgi:hypothetical protein